MKYCLFAKYLSNFCEATLVADGSSYPSVEHYFQCAKYTLANEPERARTFEIGGAVGVKPPLDAKRAGGRKGWR